jgi:hypothetical protein
MRVRDRLLDQANVSDEMFSACGLRRGGAAASSYRCTDSDAVIVPIATVIAAPRAMNREALLQILRGFRDGDDIPPVSIFHEPEPPLTYLLDGIHRLRASLAFGYVSIPVRPWSRADAAQYFRYPEGVVPL